MADYKKSEIFWREFIQQYWEKKPGYFPQIFDEMIISSDELFNSILSMPSTKTSGDRFWKSDAEVPVSKRDFSFLPIERFGPQNPDMSFDGFFSRVNNQFKNQPIGLNIHHLEKSNAALWFRFRNFVQGLNRMTGELPSGRWDIDTFFGTYKTTPLGIHRDNASVFAFCIFGNRSYYTWPADYFTEGDPALATLDPNIIDTHLEHAVRIDISQGDMVYWPSSNWHLIKSDGKPSAAISISAYFGENLSTIITQQIRQLLSTQLGNNDYPLTYKVNNIEQPPDNIISSHQTLLKMLNEGQLADMLQQYWLMFRTAEGMHSVCANTINHIKPVDNIAADKHQPIRWVKTSKGEIMISVNGLAFKIATTDDEIIFNMLRQLNTGEKLNIADLLSEYSTQSVNAETIMEIISLLNRCRAFQHADLTS